MPARLRAAALTAGLLLSFAAAVPAADASLVPDDTTPPNLTITAEDEEELNTVFVDQFLVGGQYVLVVTDQTSGFEFLPPNCEWSPAPIGIECHSDTPWTNMTFTLKGGDDSF